MASSGEEKSCSPGSGPEIEARKSASDATVAAAAVAQTKNHTSQNILMPEVII